MSSIDRDALIEALTRVLHRECGPKCWLVSHEWQAGKFLDAILPTVEQAIRAAEQRGREQAAQAIEAEGHRLWLQLSSKRLALEQRLYVSRAAQLARGGSTDEEQTP